MADTLGRLEVEIAADTGGLDRELERVQRGLQRVGREGDAAGAALRQAGGRSRDLSQGALQAAAALDDLQYGLRGVLNNIPGLVLGLGGGAGLAGALQIGAIAANALASHWDEIAAAFGSAGTATEAERMERLERATARTVEETGELLRLKREAADLARLAQARPAAEEAQAAAVTRAVGEAGGLDRVAGLLAAGRGPAETALTGAQQAALESARRRAAQAPVGHHGPELRRAAQQEVRDLEAQALQQALQRAREDLARAGRDPAALRAVIGRLPEGALRSQLEAALPERRRAARSQAEQRAMLDDMTGRRDEARAAADRARRRSVTDQRAMLDDMIGRRDEAAAGRRRQVEGLAGAYDDPFVGPLARAMARDATRGVPRAAGDAALARQIAHGARGLARTAPAIPRDLLDDVARQIVASVRDRFAHAVADAAARRGRPGAAGRPDALRRLLEEPGAAARRPARGLRALGADPTLREGVREGMGRTNDLIRQLLEATNRQTEAVRKLADLPGHAT